MPSTIKGEGNPIGLIESNIVASLFSWLFSYVINKIKSDLADNIKFFIRAKVMVLTKELLLAIRSMPSLGLALLYI